MNHVYRLVWNRAMRMWQPVSELATQARGGAARTAVYAPMRWRLNVMSVAVGLGLAAWGSAAMAACTAAGVTVTCNTAVNPLTPHYANSSDSLSVTVGPNGGVGVLLGVGGTAMLLQGNSGSVTNNGTVDAFALGNGLAVVSSGLVLGKPEGSTPTVGTYTVQNGASGVIGGSGRDTYEAQLADLTGMALSIHNGTGGVTNVTNNGIIRATSLNGGSRPGADIAAVAIYGGGVTNFTNNSTGTIAGRVAFESGNPIGNYFRNGGLISGSVSLGAGSRNTFIAESGSSISAAGLTTGTIGVTSVPGLLFAQPGTVDGGAGGNNSLVFADTFSRGLTTAVAAGTYLNFNSLTVTGGTWELSGGPLLPSGSSIALNGGTVRVDASGALGTGAIDAAGGAVGASAAGVSVGNTFRLGSGGLTLDGTQAFTVSGLLTGTGGLRVSGTQAVTLTGANDYTGSTVVNAGASLRGNTTSLQGNIVNNGTVTFSNAANGSYGGIVSGSGSLLKEGSGTLTVNSLLGHQGSTAIQAGTLRLGTGGSLSPTATVSLSTGAALDLSGAANQSINGLAGMGGTVVLGGNTLSLFNTNATTFNGVIQGSGGLVKSGLQTQTLTGANIFTGGVNITGGKLALGAGGSLAAGSVMTVGAQGAFDISAASDTTLAALNGAGGNVALGANNLTLGAGTYAGVITGTGGITKNTADSLTLDGVNTYTGATQVNAGKLLVGGSAGNSGARLNSAVTVANGASIGGFGQVNGNVAVQAGGRLAPGAPGGVFTVNGNLGLAQGSQMDFFFGAPGSSGAPGAGHSVQVNGDLALHGAQLNVNDAGGFGIGLYRLFDYTGSLATSNGGINGLTAGQTLQMLNGSKQINLINAAGLTLNLWNADRTARPNQLGGGSGIWSKTTANWTDAGASVTSAFSPVNAFAIFGGIAGTVTVDGGAGNVSAGGVQFASDGYRLNGDALNLVPQAAGVLSELRVGDGSTASAGWTTTLDNVVAGNGINKTGLGTLMLTGANTYAQTRLSAGTLSVSSDANLGAASGGLDFQGGTLRVTGTAFQSTARTITLGAAGGGLDIADANNTFTLAQWLSGNGGLAKLGAGTLVLTGANTYLGTTTVAGGKLALGAGGSLAVGSMVTVGAQGTLDISAASNTTLAALNGAGNVALGANTLTLGAGTYDGVIAGTGGISKNTTGNLTLNGVNTYTGATQVSAGALLVGGSAGNAGARLNSAVTVANGASIGGFGQVNGNVAVQTGGSLAPGAPGGIFTVNGNLALAQGSQMDFFFGAPGSSGAAGAGHSVQVNGDLALNGAQLNVNDAGGFGIGLYRLFDYTGSLTTSNGGITGLAAGQTLQMLGGSKQINLINAAGLTLNLWNADRTATPNQLGGGSGIWSRNSANWTDAGASVTSAFSPDNAFTIFGGTAGTVTVDGGAGNVSASGVQFASDGYRLNGDTLNLVAPATGVLSELRVGDGSTASSDWNATLDNVVAGNGVDKTGLGTLVLTGANTYAQTRLSAGTLSVSSDANLGAASGGLDFQGGTLRVTGTAFQNTARTITLGAAGGGLDIADAGNTFTLAQSLSGNGGLAKLGAGTLVLTGANTYLGTTTVAGGRLQVGDGATGGSIAGNADIKAGATLAFKRSDQIVYSGAISGSGNLRQEGNGTLVLKGDSSGYTGMTSVSLGELEVDGKLGGTVLAMAGSTVSGVGTLNQLTVGSGATLSPGNSVTPFGRLNVLGDLNLLQGASYRVAAAADGGHSSVNVSGVANLAGSVLHMGQNGTYAPSTTYTIVTAGGGVQGRFDDVSSNLAFLTPSLTYSSNKVDLSVQLKDVPDDGNGGERPIEFVDAASTGNQRSVARALQSLPTDSPLFRRVLNLPNGAPGEVFNGLSGEMHATAVSVTQSVANRFVQAPMNRLRANLAAHMLPRVLTAQLGPGLAALPQSDEQPLWIQVLGNRSSLGGNGNAARSTQSHSDLAVGGDVAISGGWRLGGALGHSNSRSRTGARASSAQADSYSMTVYGGKAFDAGRGKLNLSLGASYTWHDINTQRYADAAGLSQTLKADYGGNTTQVFGELGYAMPLNDGLTLEPFVGAGFSSLRTRAFTESGGDAALRGDVGRNNVTTSTLGLHARSAFKRPGTQGQLFGTLGWHHAFGDVDPASRMSFVQGGQSFTTNGVPIARDAALVELGVNMEVSRRTTVGVTYGGQFGDGNKQHSGALDVRYRF